MAPASAIAPAWYWSPERATDEWTYLWTRTWQIGPRAEELPEPGDVHVHGFGRESLLFVRQADGSVRGLFNSCRHRGSRLLLADDQPASVTEFQCPFHGWRYRLDGLLAHVPYRERFDPEQLADCTRTSLRSFRVEAFAGWLWFTLDEAAPELLAFLGPLAPRLAAYRMERAWIVDFKTLDFAANWKTVHDAFHESYHFQSLHRDILSWGNEDAPITRLGIHSMMVNEYGRPSPLYPDQETVNPALAALLAASGIDPASFRGTARDVRRAIAAQKRATSGDVIYPYDTLSDAQLTDAYHYLAFPAAHFNLFPEFYVLMRYRPHPTGDPERMYFDFIMCAPPAPGETIPPYVHRVVRGSAEPVSEILEWGPRQHPVVDQVLSEDVGLVEHVQRGLRSAGFGGAILSSDERRIAWFHSQIDALISGTPLSRLLAECPIEPDAHREPR